MRFWVYGKLLCLERLLGKVVGRRKSLAFFIGLILFIERKL
jgi:hypothetical protein